MIVIGIVTIPITVTKFVSMVIITHNYYCGSTKILAEKSRELNSRIFPLTFRTRGQHLSPNRTNYPNSQGQSRSSRGSDMCRPSLAPSYLQVGLILSFYIIIFLPMGTSTVTVETKNLKIELSFFNIRTTLTDRY